MLINNKKNRGNFNNYSSYSNIIIYVINSIIYNIHKAYHLILNSYNRFMEPESSCPP